MLRNWKHEFLIPDWIQVALHYSCLSRLQASTPNYYHQNHIIIIKNNIWLRIHVFNNYYRIQNIGSTPSVLPQPTNWFTPWLSWFLLTQLSFTFSYIKEIWLFHSRSESILVKTNKNERNFTQILSTNIRFRASEKVKRGTFSIYSQNQARIWKHLTYKIFSTNLTSLVKRRKVQVTCLMVVQTQIAITMWAWLWAIFQNSSINSWFLVLIS